MARSASSQSLDSLKELLQHLPDQVHLDEQFFQQFANSLNVATFLCNGQGVITRYNRAAELLWGRIPEKNECWSGAWKMYDVDAITILPPKKSPLAIAYAEKLFSITKEVILERPNEERSFVTIYSKIYYNSCKNITGSISLFLDNKGISGEQRDTHLAAIVQFSDDAIVSKTLNGVVTSWNAAAERIFGYTAKEMIGQPLLKIIPKDLWGEETSIQERLRKGIRIDHYETRRLTKNNEYINVSLTISPVMDSNGIIVGASKIARDITKQKQNEAALVESEERYRLAIETAKLGTWLLNIETNEFSCLAEAIHILGLSRQKDPVFEDLVAVTYPDDLNLVKEKFNWASKQVGNEVYDLEYRIIRPSDHSKRWIRLRGKLYFSSSGTPQKVIGTLLDITDEKMATEKLETTVKERTQELQQMNDLLLKSNQDLEQFAYIASHDLQEPLRKIQTFIQIVERENFSAKAISTYFEKIKMSAERMSELVKGVLNYARLDKSETQFTCVDLNQVLEEAKQDYEALIATKQADIQSSRLPVIKGLHTQLRQLFANLISNSLKFTQKKPRISITGNVLQAEAFSNYPQLNREQQYVELIFNDNGIGFDQQYAEKIFLIFQRLHSKSEYKGTGIGLALCKKIVENHHGIITACSEKHKGATFTILLPVY